MPRALTGTVDQRLDTGATAAPRRAHQGIGGRGSGNGAAYGAGKVIVARNGYRGGKRTVLRALSRLLRQAD